MNKIMSDLTQGEGDGFGDGDDRHGRRILEIPENGFAFSFPVAEVPSGEEKKITLKASVPELIPIGSIISLTISNSKIKVTDKELKIISDGLRATPKGESVAVLNAYVNGDEIGEEGKLVAKVGKLKAEIVLRIVEPVRVISQKNQKRPEFCFRGNQTRSVSVLAAR